VRAIKTCTHKRRFPSVSARPKPKSAVKWPKRLPIETELRFLWLVQWAGSLRSVANKVIKLSPTTRPQDLFRAPLTKAELCRFLCLLNHKVSQAWSRNCFLSLQF